MDIEIIEKETGKAFMNRSAGHNIFPTPYSMTEQFLENEIFDYTGSVLEPACGMGHMVRVLDKKFKNITSYDISAGKDFYNETRKFDYVITNPPFGKEADKFVLKAREVAKVKFAFLLRTNYLSGQARFESGVYKNLKTVYVFTRMPDLGQPIREDGKYKTAGIVYSWLVFEIGFEGDPVIKWIDNQKFVANKDDPK